MHHEIWDEKIRKIMKYEHLLIRTQKMHQNHLVFPIDQVVESGEVFRVQWPVKFQLVYSSLYFQSKLDKILIKQKKEKTHAHPLPLNVQKHPLLIADYTAPRLVSWTGILARILVNSTVWSVGIKAYTRERLRETEMDMWTVRGWPHLKIAFSSVASAGNV